jgi:hypothetical protein
LTSRYTTTKEVRVHPMDVETRRQLAVERAATLAHASRRPAPRSRAGRERFGFWLVQVGLRIACERPVPSQA